MRAQLVLSACLFALVAGSAAAQTEHRRTEQPRLSNVLYVCDQTPETRRAFVREYGAQAFVTAEEVLAAEAQDRRWETPRCITAREARRLNELRSQAARAN